MGDGDWVGEPAGDGCGASNDDSGSTCDDGEPGRGGLSAANRRAFTEI